MSRKWWEKDSQQDGGWWEELPRPPEWTRQALCAQVDPKPFHLEKGDSPRTAKWVCGRCEVRAECLEYALQRREPYGVWGGTTPHERRKLLRGKPLAKPRPRPETVEKVTAVTILARSRLNDVEIGRRLDMDKSAVEKIRRRHGIPAGQPQPGQYRRPERAQVAA